MKNFVEVFAKSSILDIWLGYEYASGLTARVLEITKKGP